ncbi:MAG: hypothetical protein ACK55I_41480, partial [bacterium]
MDAPMLFGSSTSAIIPPASRCLQLRIPKIVMNYKSTTHKQLKYHKVHDKLLKLQEATQLGLWSQPLQEENKKLDRIITESMLHAENCAAPTIKKGYE